MWLRERGTIEKLMVGCEPLRPSPYMRRYITFHGHYSFAPADLGGARRALRRPRRARRRLTRLYHAGGVAGNSPFPAAAIRA